MTRRSFYTLHIHSIGHCTVALLYAVRTVIIVRIDIWEKIEKGTTHLGFSLILIDQFVATIP